MDVWDYLDVDDELNLYLTVHGLKPASVLVFSSEGSQFNEIVVQDSEAIRFPQGLVDSFFATLKGICFVSSPFMTEQKSGSKIIERYTFHVADTLEHLEGSVFAESDRERGLAFGYPLDAIVNYQQIIDGVRHDGNYLAVELAKARDAGVLPPSWFSYLSFVPTHADFISGQISASAKEIGLYYQKYVRKNSPDLAQRIEKRFERMKYPSRWEIGKEGIYDVKYQ